MVAGSAIPRSRSRRSRVRRGRDSHRPTTTRSMSLQEKDVSDVSEVSDVSGVSDVSDVSDVSVDYHQGDVTVRGRCQEGWLSMRCKWNLQRLLTDPV